MYLLNIADDYFDFINRTGSENDKSDLILSTLLLSTPSGVLFSFLLSFMTSTRSKILITNEKMDIFLNPSHPVICIITGPSECGKSFFDEFIFEH